MDLINRQLAIDTIANQNEMHPKDRIIAVEILDGLSSAQPERSTGYWIEIDDARIRGRCSKCGWESHLYEDDVVGMNYCPECGAKMEGVHDGSDWQTGGN